MIIFPAIDIKNGSCVRLYKGDMNTAEKVADDFLSAADSFYSCGAEWIHMVDLDGAVKGEKVNSDIFTTVAEKTGLRVELGGGIRTMADVEYYLSRGISRVIIGSAALKNPDLVREAAKKYGEKITVGIDARRGMVAVEGWLETSDISYIELAKRMEDVGVRYIIYTDIDCDGMLSGPNLRELTLLNDAVSCNITASGGIKDSGDIKALKKAGLYGAICGRSIYKGTLDLREALEICRE